MLRYLHTKDLHAYPKLHRSMFKDRAAQFRTRLGWDVHVNERGEEQDAYDALNPLYVIWENRDGSHGGSLRFLPTTGPTMAKDHFLDLTDGRPVESPRIWECTRFCLGAGGGSRVSAALLLGGAEVGLGFGLSHALGVFDARMVRIYRRLGWGPIILGVRGTGAGAISVGLWKFSRKTRARLLLKAGLSEELSRHWFQRSFGRQAALQAI